MTAITDILSAGRTIAALADPNRSLDEIGSDMLELAESLKCLGRGMQRAQEDADEMFDRRCDTLAAGKLWNLSERREWTPDEIALARDNELKRERETAMRTAAKALLSLQALVTELGQR